MKRIVDIRAILRRLRLSLKRRPQIPSLRATVKFLSGTARRFLLFSHGQILGGRKIIKRGEVYYVPLWLPIALAILLASSVLWGDIAHVAGRISTAAVHLIRGTAEVELAEFFAPAVRHWSDEISEWSAQHDVDRHLLATVMQIESCGHPTVISNAGARGLFQVMPFHFADGENMLDTHTNARRGSNFLKHCSLASDGVIGLTLACYNGGASVINQERTRWSAETQRYYRWGIGIYKDAKDGSAKSETFDLWMEAGGKRLCASALTELGIEPDASS